MNISHINPLPTEKVVHLTHNLSNKSVNTKPCSRVRSISKFAQYSVPRLIDFTDTNGVRCTPVPVPLLHLLNITDHSEAAVRRLRSRTCKQMSHPASHMSYNEDMTRSLKKLIHGFIIEGPIDRRVDQTTKDVARINQSVCKSFDKTPACYLNELPQV